MTHCGFARYKTMVGSKADIAAAIPKASPSEPPTPEPAIPSPLEDQLLEIPANDPNKTQFVSESELRAEMDAHSADNQVIDVPPATEFTPSEIPITGDQIGASPPPSPFSDQPASEPGPANFPTSPPIPSPFSATPDEQRPEFNMPEPEPDAPQFSEPAVPAASPFEPAHAAPMAQAEFNPPSTPESNMQNPQNFGAPAAAGQNKTLSLISLIAGIAGLTICCGTFLPSLIAVILGFMGRSKANQDPSQYGGAGLATGGIITGAIGLIGGLIVWVVYFLYFAAIMASMR
jgi:hypothetical protein